MLKLRPAPFYDDDFGEERGGEKREREREIENCRTLEFILWSAPTNEVRKKRTIEIQNKRRGRFGSTSKEIVIRVKHLSPLKQKNFSTFLL